MVIKTIEKLLKYKELNNYIAKSGISKESDVDGKRADILYKNINRGSVALQQEPRDPIFIAFQNKYKKQYTQKLIQAIKENKDAKQTFKEIAKEARDNIEKEIRTKGGGTWRPNKPKTIEAKRKSKNPVIRSHAKDIYIAEEKILKSLTGFIEKKK